MYTYRCITQQCMHILACDTACVLVRCVGVPECQNKKLISFCVHRTVGIFSFTQVLFAGPLRRSVFITIGIF